MMYFFVYDDASITAFSLWHISIRVHETQYAYGMMIISINECKSACDFKAWMREKSIQKAESEYHHRYINQLSDI